MNITKNKNINRDCIVAIGFRLGDFFHLIPFLNLYSSIHLAPFDLAIGYSTLEVANFLKDFSNYKIETIIPYPDSFAEWNLNSRKAAFQHYLPYLQRHQYQTLIDASELSFDLFYSHLINLPAKWKQYLTTLTLRDLRSIRPSKSDYINIRQGHNYTKQYHMSTNRADYYTSHYTTNYTNYNYTNYIAVQPFSSRFPDKFPLYLASLPEELYLSTSFVSLGSRLDPVFPKAIDARGIPFINVVFYILNSKAFLGCHSALTVLAFYLNKPTVVCHTTPNQLKFSQFHDNCIDLLNPTSREITEALKSLVLKE